MKNYTANATRVLSIFSVAFQKFNPVEWRGGKRLKIIAILVGFALAVSFAVAQGMYVDPMVGVGDIPVEDAPDPVAAVAVKEVITQIVKVVSKAFNEVAKNSGLKSLGEAITYFAFIMVFLWGLLKGMIEGGGINTIVSELIPLAMTLAIVQALLNQGGVGYIVGFMDGIASAIAGANMGTFENSLIAATTKTFSVVEKIFSMPSGKTQMSLTSPSTWVPALGLLIAQLIAKVITAFFVVLALGIYIANIALAYGSIMLAVALSYVMVPFMLIPALSWISDSWLRFTLGAAMTKVVGAFFLTFTDKLLAGMVSLAEKVVVNPEADFTTVMTGTFVLYAGLILMAVLCAYMMMQVPGIATGLLAGSAGGAGFRGMRALTAGTGGQLGKAAGVASGRSIIGTKNSDGVRSGGAVGVGKAILAARSGQNPNIKADPAQTARQAFGATGAKVYKSLTSQKNTPPKTP